jgi:hypothetical protein
MAFAGIMRRLQTRHALNGLRNTCFKLERLIVVNTMQRWLHLF